MPVVSGHSDSQDDDGDKEVEDLTADHVGVDPDRPCGGGHRLQAFHPDHHHSEGTVQALERTAESGRGQAANRNKGHTTGCEATVTGGRSKTGEMSRRALMVWH